MIKLRLTATAEDNEAMLKLLNKLEEQGLIDILQTSNSYANRNSQYERIYVDMKVTMMTNKKVSRTLFVS